MCSDVTNIFGIGRPVPPLFVTSVYDEVAMRANRAGRRGQVLMSYFPQL